MSRVDRDPNRGHRRIPLSTVSAADLIVSMEGDNLPVEFEQPTRRSTLKGRAIRPRTVVCWADQHDECRGLRCACSCHVGAR